MNRSTLAVLAALDAARALPEERDEAADVAAFVLASLAPGNRPYGRDRAHSAWARLMPRAAALAERWGYSPNHVRVPMPAAQLIPWIGKIRRALETARPIPLGIPPIRLTGENRDSLDYMIERWAADLADGAGTLPALCLPRSTRRLLAGVADGSIVQLPLRSDERSQ